MIPHPLNTKKKVIAASSFHTSVATCQWTMVGLDWAAHDPPPGPNETISPESRCAVHLLEVSCSPGSLNRPRFEFVFHLKKHRSGEGDDLPFGMVFFRQYGEDGLNKQLRRIPILHGLQPMISCCRNHALRMSFSTMPGCRRIGERGWLPHYVQITGFCPLQHAACCLRESYNISQYSEANVINAGSLVADSSILIVTTNILIVMM